MTWNSTNLPYVPPRLTRFDYDYECSLSTLSPPPSPVTNLELISHTIRRFDITLTLSWSPPTIPNGLLAPYNVCIGIVPLEPTQEPEILTTLVASRHYCGTITGDGNSNQGTVKLDFLDRGDPDDLFIHVS